MTTKDDSNQSAFDKAVEFRVGEADANGDILDVLADVLLTMRNAGPADCPARRNGNDAVLRNSTQQEIQSGERHLQTGHRNTVSDYDKGGEITESTTAS